MQQTFSIKMKYSTLSIAVITVILSAAISTAPARVITNRGTCLSDSDCPFTHFCNTCGNPNFCPGTLYRCIRKRPRGSKCGAPNECRVGSTCAPRTRTGINEFCQALLPLNATCKSIGFFGNQDLCGENLKCDQNTKKCTFVPGISGAGCEGNWDCQVERGFYCNFNTGKCARRKKAGARCNFSGDLECQYTASCDRGFCKASKKIGEVCQNAPQCDGRLFPFGDPRLRSTIACNANDFEKGVCVKEGNLLKTLGAPCNRNNDICDRRRGMRCKWYQPSKKFVCQQDGSASAFAEFCDPNSPFSKCIPNGAPTSCRLQNKSQTDLPSVFNSRSPAFIFKRCVENRTVSKRGQICSNTRNSICPAESALSCEVIDGVEPSRTDGSIGPAEEFTTYCVKMKNNVGGECGNKFFSKCGSGLKCMNGKCVMGAPGTNQRVTHLSFGVSCSNSTAPCAPGLICNRNGKFCNYPFKGIDEGGPCYSNPFFNPVCKSGLTCRKNPRTKLLECQKN